VIAVVATKLLYIEDRLGEKAPPEKDPEWSAPALDATPTSA
jgi:hypothetical protein